MTSAVAGGPARSGPSATAANLFQLATLGGVALLTWLQLDPFGYPAVLPAAATLIGGSSIWKEAIDDVAARRVTVPVSITIVVAAELALGEFSTALITAMLVRFTSVVDGWVMARGHRSLRRPLDLLPTDVRILAPAGVPQVPLDSLRDGDVAVVLGGGRFPADGTVVNGCSLVDESAITGQPLPVRKGPGARVLAGTLNQSNALEISVERVGRQTALRQIVATLERGRLARAPIENLADRLGRFLVSGGLTAGVVALFATRDPRAAVAVVIVVGCGIAMSTRVAVLTAIGGSLARGAVVRGGVFLEALWACDTLVLASTTSVVLDEPVVRAVYPAAGVSVHDVLTAAAIAERPSDHPVGRAIVRSAAEKRLVVREPDSFSCVPRSGIRARCDGEEILVGNTAFVTQGRLPDVFPDAPSSTVFVMRGGQYLGAIALVKRVRPNAKRAIARLKSLAIKTHLLTGDSRLATEPIAHELMVDHFEPDLGPAERLRRVQELTTNRRVVMLGDAVEDASALAAATVGMAIGSAAGIGDPSADVMLLGNDVARFVEVMRLARRTHHVILENITGTLLIGATGVVLAAAGVLSPLVAVLVRTGAELAFILNSSRLASSAREPSLQPITSVELQSGTSTNLTRARSAGTATM
jgi:heavy metal translocating P-type ATPase